MNCRPPFILDAPLIDRGNSRAHAVLRDGKQPLGDKALGCREVNHAPPASKAASLAIGSGDEMAILAAIHKNPREDAPRLPNTACLAARGDRSRERIRCSRRLLARVMLPLIN